MSLAVLKHKGAAQTTSSVSTGNVVYLHKGAVQTSRMTVIGVAWKDYIPVYVVTGRSARWRTDDDEGYIPVVFK